MFLNALSSGPALFKIEADRKATHGCLLPVEG